MAEKEQEYIAFGSYKLPKGFKKITEYIITRDMTAQEKADKLMQKFMAFEGHINLRFQKKCAMIVVDEIIIALDANGSKLDKEYWSKVKNELEAI